MSRNIKEIGKELMGKSLNSFHRKTGLIQLEENNKMQDGILDGILSQVDDAYIEKTEQSNVIHLDGSGDGVVVLDGIEGNTMVNLWKGVASLATNWIQGDLTQEITNKILTVCNLTDKRIFFELSTIDGSNSGYSRGIYVESNSKLKIIVTSNEKKRMVQGRFSDGWLETEIDKFKKGVLVIEGDYTNKEISHYFEGLQSSFEEQVEEGKYKIEILSQNENIFNIDSANTNHIVQNNGNLSSNSAWVLYDYEPITPLQNIVVSEKYVNGRYFQYRMCYYDKDKKFISAKDLTGYDGYKIDITPMGAKYFRLNHSIAVNGNSVTREEIMVSYGTTYRKEYIPYKQNKIKLLLNSPLLKGDKLVVKDGKLCHYHKMKKNILNGSDNESWIFAPSQNTDNTTLFYIRMLDAKSRQEVLCDKFGQRRKDHDLWASSTETDYEAMFINHNRDILTRISTSKLSSVSMSGFKQWLKTNNVTVIYELEEPYYEDVLNEYGEPILLEGYENGTLYIDSTIVPTTTVRYTPKMESFKTLKEVKNNNIMLTNDVNDNIIPYMMDVDLMIMEKEMALMSHKNIRKMEVLDMTSMQKRTQDMLERLIKGKTLTEQECKTRVTTYLHAGKITDEQAEELMLLIDEVYA